MILKMENNGANITPDYQLSVDGQTSRLRLYEWVCAYTTDLLIAVLSFGLGCFSAGYMLGMNSKKHK